MELLAKIKDLEKGIIECSNRCAVSDDGYIKLISLIPQIIAQLEAAETLANNVSGAIMSVEAGYSDKLSLSFLKSALAAYDKVSEQSNIE